MERHEAIKIYVECEGLINMYLREIKGDCNPFVFTGTTGIDKAFNIVENVQKIVDYIFDGEELAERLNTELLNLRELTKELKTYAEDKGFVSFAGICDCIIKIINTMEKFDPIPETGDNESLNTGDNSCKNEKVEPLTTDQINAKINKIKPFLKAKANDNIPYGVYYTRLTKGEIKQADGVKKTIHVIDDEKCDFELFRSCVERADITDIIAKGNITIARLFMYYVANKFKDSGEYVKAAEKAFGLKVRLSAVPSNYRVDFYSLLGDEFPESDPDK